MGLIRRVKRIRDEYIDRFEELSYACVWHDTIRGIEWAENLPSLSPRGAAVGYNYLYVMTRILNEIKPHNVLDLGLGISSTLISHYYNYYAGMNGKHIIYEHDNSWIDFYNKNHSLSPKSEIRNQSLVVKSHNGKEYYAYSNPRAGIEGMKFDIVSIDAPFGFGFENRRGIQEYSRRDIIDLVPDILEEDYVIIVDDVDRKGEKETVKDLIDRIGGGCFHTVYRGISHCSVITSERLHFLTSL